MTRAVCPGSFDPVTHGHLDVIERTTRLVDEVVVAVGRNIAKNALFTPEERVEMLRDGVRAAGPRVRSPCSTVCWSTSAPPTASS